MRALLYLIEVVVVIALAWAVYRAVVGYLTRRRDADALEQARWKRRLVALEDGRVRVEVARPGTDNTIPVQTLDPDADGFEIAVYEAEARADDLAISLNAGERD